MKYVLLGLGWLSVLVLGLVTVNVNHNLHLPQEVLTKDVVLTKHFVNNHFPYLHTQTDIEFRQEIKDYETVRYVNVTLQEARKGDVVIFHLAGYGGSVNSVYNIVNNIRASRAKVIMSVEAPVYSGHAYLALSGDELRMSKNSYLMLHTTSGIDTDCSKETGLDRGISNVEHCQAMKDADMALFSQFLNSFPQLNPEELAQLNSGHDVYLYRVEK